MSAGVANVRSPIVSGLVLASCLSLASPPSAFAGDWFHHGWGWHTVSTTRTTGQPLAILPVGVATGTAGTATAPGFAPLAPLSTPTLYTPAYYAPAYTPTAAYPAAYPAAAVPAARPVAPVSYLADYDTEAPMAPIGPGSIVVGLGAQIVTDLVSQWASRAAADPNSLLNRAIHIFGEKTGASPGEFDLRKLRRIVERITGILPGSGSGAGVAGGQGQQTTVGTGGGPTTITITITVTGGGQVQVATPQGQNPSGQAHAQGQAQNSPSPRPGSGTNSTGVATPPHLEIAPPPPAAGIPDSIPPVTADPAAEPRGR